MTFSSEVKNELCREEITENHIEEARAEFNSLFKMAGKIETNNNESILKFTTENAAVARRIFKLVKIIYDTKVETEIKKNYRLNKNTSYNIEIRDKFVIEKILKDKKLLDEKTIFKNASYKLSSILLESRENKRAYIRGGFLGGGSISNPERSYHIEFVSKDEEFSKDLMEVINTFDLDSKIIKRKDNFVIYLKEADQISDLLNIIGAHQALLEFENIRILKDVRNDTNRLVNCETANLNKVVNASMRQVENILLIDRKIGLKNIPENLRDISEIRLNNRHMSLKEIGELLDPPISKSGVNHRFRKLDKLADDIREGNYE